MKKSNEIVCFPVKDNTKRFLIGKRGQYEMLAIALNPSAANENKLDPTSKNIELIAYNNGWISKKKLISSVSDINNSYTSFIKNS